MESSELSLLPTFFIIPKAESKNLLLDVDTFLIWVGMGELGTLHFPFAIDSLSIILFSPMPLTVVRRFW